MKDITAITILENISMWSMLNADEYHALKMGIEALRTKAKEQAAIDTALKNIKTQMCDHYCKYAESWDEDDGPIEDAICKSCPLTRL